MEITARITKPQAIAKRAMVNAWPEHEHPEEITRSSNTRSVSMRQSEFGEGRWTVEYVSDEAGKFHHVIDVYPSWEQAWTAFDELQDVVSMIAHGFGF